MTNKNKNDCILSINEGKTLSSLNAILASAATLKRRMDYDKENADLLSQIEKNCLLLCSVSTRTFTELRHFMGKTPYVPAIFTFAELFSDIKRALHSIDVIPDIILTADCNTLVCDREKLARMLFTVIATAKVLRPDIDVTILLNDDKISVFITVRLEGLSLDEATLEYLNSDTDAVFEELLTKPTIYSNLLYTKIVSEIHKGKISFSTNRESDYTEFTFAIPKDHGASQKKIRENRNFIVSLADIASQEYQNAKNFIIKEDN